MTVDGQNKLEVKGGYHENKTTGKYKIECDEHEVYVLSSGMKERINGGYDGDVNGNYALVTHGNFDHTISLNTTISHHGKYDIKYLGPKKTWKYVDEKSATYGISQSMFFGLKNEGSLSAKVENAYSLTLTSKAGIDIGVNATFNLCLLYTSPSPRDATLSRMPSSA